MKLNSTQILNTYRLHIQKKDNQHVKSNCSDFRKNMSKKNNIVQKDQVQMEKTQNTTKVNQENQFNLKDKTILKKDRKYIKNYQSGERKQNQKETLLEQRSFKSALKQKLRKIYLNFKTNEIEQHGLEQQQIKYSEQLEGDQLYDYIFSYYDENEQRFKNEQMNILVQEYLQSQSEKNKLQLESIFQCAFTKNIVDFKKFDLYQLNRNRIYNSLKQKNYYLSKYIASGGEGDVFLGYQKKQNEGEIEEYVFKIYLNRNGEELKEEVNIMKSFEENINIIKLKDEIQQDNGLHILVLEKCQYSLKDELVKIESQKLEFSIQQLLQIIFDLLDGLIQLRIYQTLHLDIKPHNILKTEEKTYVYTDFGCSSKFKQGGEIQQKGFTIKYASDEQLNNQNDKIHYKSDTQSLGKTFKQIIDIFSKVNKNSISNPLIQQIKNIIEDQMDKNNITERQDIQVIHSSFFELLMKDEIQFVTFLYSYCQKIFKIKNSFAYDSRKDIIYFQDILIYYSKIHLTILKFLKNVIYYYEPKKTYSFQQSQIPAEKYIDYDKQLALNSVKKPIQIKMKYCKDMNPMIGQCLQFLGECCNNQGDSENALKYAEESLQIFKQFYKRNHQSTVNSLQLLGQCYYKLGDLKNALDYAQQSLKMNIILYQGNHPSIVSSLYYQALCYHDMGDLQLAFRSAKEQHERTKQLYEGNHPETARSFSFLGLCFQSLGNYQYSYDCAKKSLEMNQQLYSGNHPSVALSLDFLGECCNNIGEPLNALKYANESYEMKKQIYKRNNPAIAFSLNFLGLCYLDLGDKKNALKCAKESHQIFLSFYQGNHPSIASSLHLLGLCHTDFGNEIAAQKYADHSDLMRESIYNGNHPLKVSSKLLIGQCKVNQGYYFTIDSIKESLNIAKQLYGENHPQIATSLQIIGQNYINQRYLAGALKYAKESLHIWQNIYQGNHPKISSSLMFLGKVYKFMGNFRAAIKYAKQSLEMSKQLYSGHHPAMLSSLSLISNCYFKIRDGYNGVMYEQEYKKMEKQLKEVNQQM